MAKLGNLSRNNCGTGYATGAAVIYTVNAGTYASNTSQDDADQKAQHVMNTNGQSYANTNGWCISTTATLTLATNKSLGATYRLVINDTNQIFNFPSSGSATFTLTPGTYNSVSIAPVGQPSSSSTFKKGLDLRSPVTEMSATFSNVNFNSRSADLNVSIN